MDAERGESYSDDIIFKLNIGTKQFPFSLKLQRSELVEHIYGPIEIENTKESLLTSASGRVIPSHMFT